MSLIGPSTRWWNRPAVRRTGAWVCWIISMLSVFAAGWSFGAVFDRKYASLLDPDMVITVAFPLGLILMLAGGFLYFLAGEEDEFEPRIVIIPLAFMFMAQGLGRLAYGFAHAQAIDPTAAGFVVLGALALIVSEVFIRRAQRNEALRQKVRQSGVVTRGQVTRARAYYANYARVTRVTVAFVDNAGRKRWVSQTVGGAVSKGQALTVRYSPADLGRRAGVVVER